MGFNRNKTLVLSSMDMQEILRNYGIDQIMQTLTNKLRIAIKHYNSKKVSIPVRGGFHYEKPQSGLIEWMPLYNQGEKVLIKVVGYHPSNPNEFNLPTIISTISEYDTKSGHLSALMDGVLSTAIRTGAASAVASEIMAHPESSTLGLIGCGAQAVTQLHSLSQMFRLKKVLINDTDSKALLSFINRCSVLNLDIDFIDSSIEEVVKNSDILCTATTIDIGAGPLFSNLETKPHLHINAVGSDFPGKIEIPFDFLEKSFICPDFIEQAVVEGECQQIEREDIDSDLVDIVQNPNKYEYVKNKTSVFDSTGWALEDKVAMDLFLDCASELNLGQELEIENFPNDTKNPYDFLEQTAISLDDNKLDVIKELSLSMN